MTIMDGVHSPQNLNQAPLNFQIKNQQDRTSIKENPLEYSLIQKGSARYLHQGGKRGEMQIKEEMNEEKDEDSYGDDSNRNKFQRISP